MHNSRKILYCWPLGDFSFNGILDEIRTSNLEPWKHIVFNFNPQFLLLK